MVVIVVVHPAPTAATPAAAGHGQTAFFADLSVLCLHAGSGFRHVRDGVVAQPHGVRRASLLDVDGGRALGAGLVKATKQQRADRQCQSANEKHGPHLSYPGLEKNSHSGPKVADPPSMVQAKKQPNQGCRFNGGPRQNPGLYGGGFRQYPWCSARCRLRRFPPSHCQRTCAGKISRPAW
jgi:hypothetical protein